MPGAPETGHGQPRVDATAGEVRIRDVAASDVAVFFAHQSDPDAIRMAAFRPRSPQEFLAHWKRVLANPDIVKKTIVHNRRIAGNLVGFEQAGKSLIGYWLGREHWGQGIATRALGQFLRIVRQRPVYAFVAKRNAGSLRVLQKCGFRIMSQGVGAPDENGTPVEELALILDEPSLHPTVSRKP